MSRQDVHNPKSIFARTVTKKSHAPAVYFDLVWGFLISAPAFASLCVGARVNAALKGSALQQ
jgi:hypothetical protein